MPLSQVDTSLNSLVPSPHAVFVSESHFALRLALGDKVLFGLGLQTHMDYS